MHPLGALRSSLAAAVVAVTAAVATGAADTSPPDASAPNPAAGQLLIASPAIKDPRFARTVILLLRHDDKGAFGIIINRPLAERPIAELLAATVKPGAKPPREDRTIAGTIPVFIGGPVQPQLGFVVHSPDYRRDGTLMVDHVAGMTADPQVLRDIGHHHGPKRRFFALGYTGWGPGQLDAEIARHDWFTTPADAALIFDDDRAAVWDRALARRTREL